MSRFHERRRGSTTVEFALVAPIVLFLLLGSVVGGLGVFRYHEITAIARESSRWLSVRGMEYHKVTGKPAATPEDVYENVIKPRAVGLDLDKLNYTVTWDTDNHPYHTIIEDGDIVPVTNTVTVTITYEWVPEAFFPTMTLSSSSQSLMSY